MTEPRVFEEEKIVKTRKTKSKKFDEPVLKLEEEEPLILEEVHQEKKLSTQNI